MDGYLLALDPSLTCTGWAEFVGGQLTACGSVRPKRKGTYLERMEPVHDLLIANIGHATEVQNLSASIAVEVPTGKVHSRHGGGGAGLSKYGVAVGMVLIQAARLSAHVHEVPCDWMGKEQKQIRQRRYLMDASLSVYRGNPDVGCDIADAIGVGLWALQRTRIEKGCS